MKSESDIKLDFREVPLEKNSVYFFGIAQMGERGGGVICSLGDPETDKKFSWAPLRKGFKKPSHGKIPLKGTPLLP